MHVAIAITNPATETFVLAYNRRQHVPRLAGLSGSGALQDDIKDQLGNEETQAGILLNLGRASQAEEVYRYPATPHSCIDAEINHILRSTTLSRK